MNNAWLIVTLTCWLSNFIENLTAWIQMQLHVHLSRSRISPFIQYPHNKTFRVVPVMLIHFVKQQVWLAITQNCQVINLIWQSMQLNTYVENFYNVRRGSKCRKWVSAVLTTSFLEFPKVIAMSNAKVNTTSRKISLAEMRMCMYVCMHVYNTHTSYKYHPYHQLSSSNDSNSLNLPFQSTPRYFE